MQVQCLIISVPSSFEMTYYQLDSVISRMKKTSCQYIIIQISRNGPKESYTLYESITKTEIRCTALLSAVNLIAIVPCYKGKKPTSFMVSGSDCIKMYVCVP